MQKVWSEEAWEDYLYWQLQDKKTLRKINQLIKDIERNGYNCSGPPAQSNCSFSLSFRVRLDNKNRIVFSINKN